MGQTTDFLIPNIRTIVNRMVAPRLTLPLNRLTGTIRTIVNRMVELTQAHSTTQQADRNNKDNSHAVQGAVKNKQTTVQCTVLNNTKGTYTCI